MRLDPILFSLIGDIFINLAAGWFAMIIITPRFIKKRHIRLPILISDILTAIVCILLAYVLKKL